MDAEEIEAMWSRRRARHLLLSLVPLYALSGAALYALRDAVAGGALTGVTAQLWTFLALAPVHAALWWWSGRALVGAVAAAAGLFVLQEIVLAFYDPLGLARGIFLKLALGLVLVQAFRATRAAKSAPASASTASRSSASGAK